MDLSDNFSYVTGGTSFFVNHTNTGDMKHISVHDNQIIACGLSAIGSGVRSFVSAKKTIENIDIRDNTVIGFTCAITSNLHGGINIDIAETASNGSVIKNAAVIGNNVDYLAPWETFNTTDGDVDGSYNTNKVKGATTGNQAGYNISAGTTGGSIEKLYFDSKISNHQGIGIFFEELTNVNAIVDIYRCGWTKDDLVTPTAATAVQQSLNIAGCENISVSGIIDNNAYGVDQNNSYTTPIKSQDNNNITFDLTVKNNNNQNRTLLLTNSVAGYSLTINRLDSDAYLDDAGYLNLVDDTAGTETRNTNVFWNAKQKASIISGSRSLPLGIDTVGNLYATGAKTITLYKAAYYTNKTISINPNGITITVTPATGETIDNVTGNHSVTTKEYLFSDGTEWFSV